MVSILEANGTPQNTVRNTQWALNNYNDWAKSRKFDEISKSKELGDDLMLCRLKRWFAETKRVDGTHYRGDSMNNLYAAIARFIFEILYSILQKFFRYLKDLCGWNIYDRNGPFKSLMLVAHSVIQSRNKEEREKKKARPLSDDEYSKILESLNFENLDDLQIALFITQTRDDGLRGGYFFLNFYSPNSLIGGYQFKFTDLMIMQDEKGFKYIRYFVTVCKNNQMGLSNHSSEPLEIRQYADGTKFCPVYLLQTLTSKRPPNAPDRLWLRTLKNGTEFSIYPRGHNWTNSLLKETCARFGIEKTTNHAGRRKKITSLTKAKVSDTVIQQYTGLRDARSLNQYRARDSNDWREIASMTNPNLNQSTSSVR